MKKTVLFFICIFSLLGFSFAQENVQPQESNSDAEAIYFHFDQKKGNSASHIAEVAREFVGK